MRRLIKHIIAFVLTMTLGLLSANLSADKADKPDNPLEKYIVKDFDKSRHTIKDLDKPSHTIKDLDKPSHTIKDLDKEQHTVKPLKR
ncbi:MAG: hypothetical protein QNK11_02180 [Legionella sp.]|nr:hypothetical protein [Legionella sp.]